MSHEIYRTRLSLQFERKTFTEVAAFVYKEFQGILFGLELEIDKKIIVILNPGNYEIPDIQVNKVHVYIVCEDKKVADIVATYDMTPEQRLLYDIINEKEDKNNKIKDEEDMFKMQDFEPFDGSHVSYPDEDNDLLETDYI